MTGQTIVNNKGARFGLWAALAATTFALAGCQEGQPLAFLKAKPASDSAEPAPGQVIEKDVEAPQVFSANEDGLWDGRPSLGGVWVAHPSAKDPERVMIRNEANGQSVIGALFRREHDNPGPKLQVSSDAAEAIGLLAGAPTKLSVVALRRETIEIPPPEPAPLVEDPKIATAAEIETKPIDKVVKSAEAALDKAEKAAPAPTVTSTPTAPIATKGKMFVQLGIFSIESNATGVVEKMAKEGIIATIRKGQSGDKTFWRVLAGPAASASDRTALLKKVRSLGYADAYTVSN
ncbi:SPOR domain-containing protein [Thioclava sp. A2]|uniref:SPOR domain-containing protein n=1 Tax=Thioclava sp. FCG-A2 TaxID=3080562 RepID=UPI002954B822|nr:SPOR domain-containing protein [Thioclava sp. A2]MDV7270186.1 SPOR domain-containing protein [Thioclava sp. A2]